LPEGLIRPRKPGERTIRIRDPREYSEIPPAYLEIAQAYANPWLMGPPLCDELVNLVEHMFDEEEAQVMRHIKPFRLGKTAEAIAAGLNRPVDEVDAILRRLCGEKCIILGHGPQDHQSYHFLPLFPGVMENILFRNSRGGITPWHERFAVLFDTLYNTGYIVDYSKHHAEMVRFLPVNQGIVSDARAWPSDRLEEILDRFRSFAVTFCQCRMAMDLKGEACGKPLETCVMMGVLAEHMVSQGRMRRIDKQEVLDIKKNAEDNGLVTWIGNVESIAGSNISCSCCGCCCYMLRMTTQFSVPAMIARPHFLPRHQRSRCRACGACMRVCQTGAISFDASYKNRIFDHARCLGCGLCVGACPHAALELQEASGVKNPPRNAFSYLLRILPGIVKNTLNAMEIHKGR